MVGCGVVVAVEVAVVFVVVAVHPNPPFYLFSFAQSGQIQTSCI